MFKLARLQAVSRVTKPKPQLESTATLLGHIFELRRRLFWVGFFFFIGSTLAYIYRKPLLEHIVAPLQGEKLIYLTPGGGFMFVLQVSIAAGLLMAAPVILYHLHAFIKPALPESAQRSVVGILLFATVFITGGVAYGYFVAIPAALHFLKLFDGEAITANITTDSYLSFFLAYTAGLALLSLLPIILVFVHWIRPLTPGGLLKSERWVILFSFVAAAIITPTPDIINQLMIAGPVIAIYQVGIMAVLIAIARARRLDRKELAIAS